jgi:dihydrofolate reductase
MGKLIYLMNVTLDGYVETPDHGLDWGTVDEELHFWFAEHMRAVDASLYGRRLYEVMAAYWPGSEADPNATPAMRAFGTAWRETPRFVFSSSLESVDHGRVVRGDDVGAELARIREEFDGDLEVGGPTLAASFIRRGLVDEYRLVVHPVVLGAGTPYLPPLGSPIKLRQTESRRFGSGVLYIGYAVA